jgi:RsiW-degrading membrane proteinase PrsW (M82 family)
LDNGSVVVRGQFDGGPSSLDLPPAEERVGRANLLWDWCKRLASQRWSRFLVGGAVLWALAVGVTFATRNSNLVPTVVLLGSFLVPATWVIRAIERDHPSGLPLSLILRLFVYGGVLGLLVAALLENWLLRNNGSALAYVGVGLIEEAAKLAVLVLMTRRLYGKTMRDGIITGATVGFGFAAFESAGYAFNALLTPTGLSLRSLVATQVARSVLAPVSHGLWTAIIGAILFRDERRGRFRLSSALIGVYLLASSLHAVWDIAPGAALTATMYLTGHGWQGTLIQRQYLIPNLTRGQLALDWTIDDTILLIVSILGLFTLRRFRQQAQAQDDAGITTGPALTSQGGLWLGERLDSLVNTSGQWDNSVDSRRAQYAIGRGVAAGDGDGPSAFSDATDPPDERAQSG